MNPSPPSLPARRPWEQRTLGFPALFGLVLLAFVLLWLIMFSGFMIYALWTTPSSSPLMDGLGIAGGAVVLALSVRGFGWLIPKLPRPTQRFRSRFAPVAPATLGYPFDVSYQGRFWFRSLMTLRGEVRFEPQGLTINGTLDGKRWARLASSAALVLVPVLAVRAGWMAGLAPLMASIALRALGLRKITRTIPYSEMRDLKVRGLKVSFCCDGSPSNVAFAVSEGDGERLYRELLPHFPEALGGWTG